MRQFNRTEMIYIVSVLLSSKDNVRIEAPPAIWRDIVMNFIRQSSVIPEISLQTNPYLYTSNALLFVLASLFAFNYSQIVSKTFVLSNALNKIWLIWSSSNNVNCIECAVFNLVLTFLLLVGSYFPDYFITANWVLVWRPWNFTPYFILRCFILHF